MRVPMTGGRPSQDRLLLVWPGTDTSSPARLRDEAADSALPKAVRPSQSADAAIARALARAVTDASVSVSEINLKLLPRTPLSLLLLNSRILCEGCSSFGSWLVRRSREM